jgi:hypothetical protein
VDGAGRDDRADDTETQGDAAPFDELIDDLGLLRRRRGIERADQLPELLLGALGSEDESQDAGDERQDRYGREEELEGDRTGEEGTLVVSERRQDGARVADECPDRGQDAASLFGAGLSAAFVSDLVSPFVSALVSLLESLFTSDLLSLFLSELLVLSDELFSPGRLSVLYQPDPLKTIAGIDRRRRGFLPQLGHFCSASSLNDWTAENTWPQWSQR